MEVTYSDVPKGGVPSTAQHTEITTYAWPGFLGEWCAETQEWTAWELTGPTTRRVRLDIHAPPKDCLGQFTARLLVWSTQAPGPSEYRLWPEGPLEVRRQLPLPVTQPVTQAVQHVIASRRQQRHYDTVQPPRQQNNPLKAVSKKTHPGLPPRPASVSQG